jgi:hypothetical protein
MEKHIINSQSKIGFPYYKQSLLILEEIPPVAAQK